jgi:uncharacterized protein (DUF1697 family)
MPVFVALLRGVNVTGNNQIKMEVLRALCESLGHECVQTYIASGNVVFRTKLRDPKRLARVLEDAIEQKLGFRPTVVMRTPDQLRETVAQNPFARRKQIEPSKLLVCFMLAAPDAEALNKLSKLETAPEELHVVGQEMYIYFLNGQGKSDLKLSKIDKILQMPYTGRNWNTVNKLLEMADALERG